MNPKFRGARNVSLPCAWRSYAGRGMFLLNLRKLLRDERSNTIPAIKQDSRQTRYVRSNMIRAAGRASKWGEQW